MAPIDFLVCGTVWEGTQVCLFGRGVTLVHFQALTSSDHAHIASSHFRGVQIMSSQLSLDLQLRPCNTRGTFQMHLCPTFL